MELTKILEIVAGNENSAFFFTPPNYKNEKCYLFTSPDIIHTISSCEEYKTVFEEIEVLKKDHYIAGLMNYEAGYLFEDSFKEYLTSYVGESLITLLCYKKENCLTIENCDLIMPDDEEYSSLNDFILSDFRFNISSAEYYKAIERIKKYIYDGDTYQVNYTLKNRFNFKGSLSKLFLNLITNQSARYTAFINLYEKVIISVSPELFFEIDRDIIKTRPMKGTLHRGINQEEDDRMKNILLNSEKDRAENVMIADLLRNDIGRIAQFGTVKADSLFDIEKYESVFQMTSSISAELKERSIGRIISELFPCGSITGAPKMKTIHIIKELEKEARGIYTGAIGIIHGNSAMFNVAIRTLVISKSSGEGEIGLGGGIVWDSVPEKEYNEVILKGKFLTRQDVRFQLIETILYENGSYFLLDEHLKRLKTSADYFLFNCELEKVSEELKLLTSHLSDKKRYRARLILSKDGRINLSSNELGSSPSEVKVMISEKRIDSRNKFQYFKTTYRELYNSEYKAASEKECFDVLFLNEKEILTEGAITNIFLQDNKDNWFTPKLSSGILAGCYRDYFLKQKIVVEKDFTIVDLKTIRNIILVNSVRKEIPVKEIWNKNELIWEQDR